MEDAYRSSDSKQRREYSMFKTKAFQTMTGLEVECIFYTAISLRNASLFSQSLALLGLTAAIFLMATPGFALFAGDDPRKIAILNVRFPSD